jgi:hypothetical protein
MGMTLIEASARRTLTPTLCPPPHAGEGNVRNRAARDVFLDGALNGNDFRCAACAPFLTLPSLPASGKRYAALRATH